MDRIDLVMAENPVKTDGSAKLRNSADLMYAIKVTLDSRGWKTIIAPYLENRLNLDRFLQTKNTQERHEIHGALSELQDFINFLNRKIEDGEKAVLELSKKGNK